MDQKCWQVTLRKPGVSPVGASRTSSVRSVSADLNLNNNVFRRARSCGASKRNGTLPHTRLSPSEVVDFSESIVGGSMINSQLSSIQMSSASAAQPQSRTNRPAPRPLLSA